MTVLFDRLHFLRRFVECAREHISEPSQVEFDVGEFDRYPLPHIENGVLSVHLGLREVAGEQATSHPIEVNLAIE
jgi:hypothetical protein